MSTPSQPLFDMSKATPLFDMSKAQPLNQEDRNFPGTDIPRMPSKIPPSMLGHPEEGLQPEDIPKHAKAAAEVLGGMAGGEAFSALKGTVGVLMRILGTGAGAGTANAALQAATTGTVNPTEALQTGAGFAAGAAVGEAPGFLSEARTALRELFFTPEGKITPIGKALSHPLDAASEFALRKVVGAPEAPVAPVKAESVPITRSPNYDPAAYRAGVAQRTTPPAPAPTPSPIAEPGSPLPQTSRTLVSYPRTLLVEMAKHGDLEALRELIRNPGGIDWRAAVPNAKYMLEFIK